jgi:chromate reductase, NAD(P)H dehydrogenase (quinone)
VGAMIHVVGLCGSLRAGSFNARLLRAAGTLVPEGMSLTVADIAPLPFYNADLVPAPGAWPPPVQAFRDQLAAADAYLFVSPEYNYSVPGALKNALDWASRPPGPPMATKPCAIMGITTGMFGTVRMQMHLRQVCVFMDLHPLNKPEVLVPKAEGKFDADGRLVDEETRKMVGTQLVALRDWASRFKG